MDDREYYSMMNRSNSALIIQEILKKTKQKSDSQKKEAEVILESRQGREDTEMLHEKKGHFKNEE